MRSLPKLAWGLALGAAVLLLGAAGATLFLGRTGPPPPSIAADPVLVRGFEIDSTRCVACHGPAGRGDGPLAKSLAGPAPRSLVEDHWKYGDAPEQVLAVLTTGIKDSAMPAWGNLYGRDDLKATAAYVYHLAERSVPAVPRVP